MSDSSAELLAKMARAAVRLRGTKGVTQEDIIRAALRVFVEETNLEEEVEMLQGLAPVCAMLLLELTQEPTDEH